IGSDQDDGLALFLQRLHRLRARIVEFAGLADHDGTGADDQDGGDVGSFGHLVSGIWAQKKGAHAARPWSRSARLPSARGVVFRPDSAPAKPPKSPHQPAISGKKEGFAGGGAE